MYDYMFNLLIYLGHDVVRSVMQTKEWMRQLDEAMQRKMDEYEEEEEGETRLWEPEVNDIMD